MAETNKKKFEYFIFTALVFIVIFGLIVLYSASSIYAKKTYGSSVYLFLRQLIFCIVGIFLTLFISFTNYKMYVKLAHYFFIACFVLVILTTFAGRISRGSSRWFELRGVTFQPSELMKLALILYLPTVLKELKDKLDRKDSFLRLMIVAYAPTFIVALNNLSTGIILFTIATFMIFIVSRKWLIFVFIITMFVLFYLFAFPMSKVLYNVGLLKQYQVSRIFAWKDPVNYPDNAYQTLQSLYAIGSGKIFGRGYLSSIQKALIPEAQNDMIFAVLCEELGLLGAALLLILYSILVFRIFHLAMVQNNLETVLLTFGIGIHIGIQIILNIGVVTNLLPNTGVTLPFVSYGGSSLIVMFIEIGLIMSVSRYGERV